MKDAAGHEHDAEGKFTCQICARPIKAKTGSIAHHGYRRPDRGSGWQTASCMGARHLPYEQSRDRLPAAIASVKSYLGDREKYEKKLVHGVELPNPRHNDWLKAKIWGQKVGEEPPKTIKPEYETRMINYTGTPEPQEFEVSLGYGRTYSSVLDSVKRAVAQDIEGTKEQLKYFEDRYDNWKDPAKTEKARTATVADVLGVKLGVSVADVLRDLE